MSSATFQIVKLGGSLLDLADWQDRWWAWFRAAGVRQTVVVVGGGATVDELRAQQIDRRLSDADAHWEAIAAMGKNARMAAQTLFGDASQGLVKYRLESLKNATRTLPVTFVDPLKLLQQDEPFAEGARLPISWDVTSDSIAARLAELLGCPQLTLLKSALCPGAATYAEAARAGYVDQFFPWAAASLQSVTCVNLQSPEREQQVLTPGNAG